MFGCNITPPGSHTSSLEVQARASEVAAHVPDTPEKTTDPPSVNPQIHTSDFSGEGQTKTSSSEEEEEPESPLQKRGDEKYEACLKLVGSLSDELYKRVLKSLKTKKEAGDSIVETILKTQEILTNEIKKANVASDHSEQKHQKDETKKNKKNIIAKEIDKFKNSDSYLKIKARLKETTEKIQAEKDTENIDRLNKLETSLRALMATKESAIKNDIKTKFELEQNEKQSEPYHSAENKAEIHEAEMLQEDLQTLLKSAVNSRNSFEKKILELDKYWEKFIADEKMYVGQIKKLCDPFLNAELHAKTIPIIPKVPDPDSEDWESQCDPDGKKNFEAMPYQTFASELATPENNANLFIFHDMGTGKTCTIVLCILRNLVYYYHKRKELKKPNDAIPICLVLSQNKESVSKYATELTGDKRCGKDMLDEFIRETKTEWKYAENPRDENEGNSIVWSFFAEDSINKTLPYFRVIFNMMSRAVVISSRKELDWAQDLPVTGLVIVDEAHNLFDVKNLATNQHNNHVEKYIDSMCARMERSTFLKLVLLTGTPTTEHFGSLMKFIGILCQKGKSYLKSVSENDEDEIKKYFELSDGTWKWKPDKHSQLVEDVRGKVSYVTLANDPRVYPRFGIRLKVPTNKRGEFIELTPLEKGVVLTQNKAEEGGYFHVEDVRNMTNYVLIKVPPSPLLQKKTGNALKTHNNFFKYTSETETPPAWNAVCSLVKNNNQSTKHFLYMDVRLLPEAFYKYFCIQVLGSNDKKVYIWSELFKTIKNIKTWKEQCKRTGGCMAVDIRDGREMKSFQELYNSKENTDGQLIKYVFGGPANKEGMDLFSTHYVHVLTPPEKQRSLQQIVRRTMRFCSMQHVADARKNWIVTVLLYCVEMEIECCNNTSCKQAGDWKITPGIDADPVDLVLELLKENAVDCDALKALTKVRCDTMQKDTLHLDLWGGNPLQGAEVSNYASSLRISKIVAESFSERDNLLLALLQNETKDHNSQGQPSRQEGFQFDTTGSALSIYKTLQPKRNLAVAVKMYLEKKKERYGSHMNDADISAYIKLKKIAEDSRTELTSIAEFGDKEEDLHEQLSALLARAKVVEKDLGDLELQAEVQKEKKRK